MSVKIISIERQAELISEACKKAGLDGHIRWIERKKDAYTWAEKIAMGFKGKETMPVKNSYMMCDALDMCFFFDEAGRANMAYAGCTSVDQPDIFEGKLLQAFEKADQILKIMQNLMREETEPVEMDEEALRLYQKVRASFYDEG